MSILDFSGSYQPPGVYIQQQTPQVISVPVTTPNIVALVGPTRGYLTFMDAFVLSGSQATTLTQKGINQTTIVVTNAYGTVFAATNYTVTQTGVGAAIVTTIQLTAAGVTNIGSTPVFISYQYTDANYFQPYTFHDYNSVVAAYGAPFDANNNLTSPISLAAQFVYANGNPTTIVMPTTDTNLTATRNGLSTAYTSLSSNPYINLVVPLPVGMTGTVGSPGDIYNVGQDLKTHCDSLAQQGIFRIGLYGYETSVTITPDLVANNITDPRVTVAYPNQLLYFNGPNNTTLTIGGMYLAAAFAGFLASNPVQQGLTRQTVRGFSGIPNSMYITMTRQAKNTWSAAGASVVEITGNGAMVCRQGVTTSVTTVTNREISLVCCADLMMFQVEETLNNSGLIGAATNTNTPAKVQTVVQTVLDGLVALGVIVGYQGLNASVTSTNPTTITVTYSYSPAYPLNYIAVQFSVNTSTGSVTSVAAA